MGSLSLAITRKRGPMLASVQDGIAAGHGLGLSHERKRPQRMALTLRLMYVFPMTSHTECVALLEPADVCARLR